MTKLFLVFLLQFSFWTYAQTGISNPYMTACDANVSNFLSTYNIPGATFALSKDGKLIYLRAFGNANTAGTEMTQPYHKFRIASLSKPITSIAIMKLVEDGLLNLNDLVFGTSGILGTDLDISSVVIADSRIYNIKVQHLLEHSAGWNRDLNCFPRPTSPYPYQTGGCDPISAPLYVSNITGTPNPVSKTALMRFLLEKGLDFAPGTSNNYSNIGYLFLGRIIEKKTGLTYENYVKNNIFTPLGICDIELGKNLKADKKEREGEYIGNGYSTLSCYGTGVNVPWEYGGFNIEAMDAHGGWIATASDLVKLLVAVDNFSTKPDILSSATINTMVTPSATTAHYAKGWNINSADNWWHTGALDGTSSIMVRTNGGYTWAIILNKRIIGSSTNSFWSDLDDLPWDCIANATGTPTFDLMLHPLLNASSLTVNDFTNSSISLSWTAGDGDQRLLVCSKNNPINSFPLDGVTYADSSAMGLGDDLGGGNFIVYNGKGNSVIVNNLDPESTYHFRLFEYNENVSTGNNPLYKLCNCPTFQFNTTNTLSLTDNILFQESLKIYPNPVNNAFTITDKKIKFSTLEIYNTHGAIILSLIPKNSMSNIEIDVSHIPAGVYFIKAKDKNNHIVATNKMIKK